MLSRFSLCTMPSNVSSVWPRMRYPRAFTAVFSSGSAPRDSHVDAAVAKPSSPLGRYTFFYVRLLNVRPHNDASTQARMKPAAANAGCEIFNEPESKVDKKLGVRPPALFVQGISPPPPPPPPSDLVTPLIGASLIDRNHKKWILLTHLS